MKLAWQIWGMIVILFFILHSIMCLVWCIYRVWLFTIKLYIRWECRERERCKLAECPFRHLCSRTAPLEDYPPRVMLKRPPDAVSVDMFGRRKKPKNKK